MQPENVFYGGGAGPQNYQTPKRKIGRRVLFLCIGLVLMVLVVVAIAVATSGSGSQKAVADDFVAKFVASDTEGSYALLTPSTKRTESINTWSTKVNLTKDFYEKYVASEQLVDGGDNQRNNQAEVHTYMAKGKDGTYAFFVTVSKDRNDPGVISFEAAPFADTRNLLK